MPNFKEEMTEGMEDALAGSIIIWENRANGVEDRTLCLLCKAVPEENMRCTGCPVAIAGYTGCLGTPYGIFADHRYDCSIHDCPKHVEAAQAEVTFLRGIMIQIKEEELREMAQK